MDNRMEHLQKAIKERIKYWSEVKQYDIVLKKLSGLTNINYKVEHTDGKMTPLVLKTFAGSDGLHSRNKEKLIWSELSEVGVSPKLYYYDDTMCICEFLEEARNPTIYDLTQYEKGNIIYRMIKFHSVKIPELEKHDLFWTLQPEKFIETVKEAVKIRKFYEAEQINKFYRIYKFVTYKHKYIIELFCPKRKETLRLCHNDLNNMNIMLQAKNKKYFFIDLEESSMNYLAYDIANFLNEAAIDYSVPSPGFQVHYYLVATEYQIGSLCRRYLESESKYANKEAIYKLAYYVQQCMSLCNFYWSCWSIMVYFSSKNFDYLGHGIMRVEKLEKAMSKAYKS